MRVSTGIIRTFSLFLVVLYICSLCSCSSGGGGDDSNSTGDGGLDSLIQQIVGAVTTESDGSALAVVNIPENTTKFSLTTISANNAIQITSVISADGTDHMALTRQVTQATDFQLFSNTANVPSRDFDPGVTAGDYLVGIKVGSAFNTNNGIGGEQVTIITNASGDTNFESGVLPLNVFFVGAIAQGPSLKTAVRDALGESDSIYSSQAGISLDIREFDVAGPNVLPFPFIGSDMYTRATAIAPQPAVNVFIGADIGDSTGNVFGVAGGIPGSPISGAKSAVVVSLVAHGGPDGIISPTEVLVLGETIAHESGHFMGLFHPVELLGQAGPVADVDPLSDTLECSNVESCNQNGDLIGNLMYPTPIVNPDGSLVRQENLTRQQGGVLNRYIAVK